MTFVADICSKGAVHCDVELLDISVLVSNYFFHEFSLPKSFAFAKAYIVLVHLILVSSPSSFAKDWWPFVEFYCVCI